MGYMVRDIYEPRLLVYRVAFRSIDTSNSESQ